MKKLVYPVVLLGITCSAYAQPTITKMENYSIGTEAKQLQCTFNVGPGTAGANQHWSFTNLSVIDTITERIIPVSATSFGTNFPGAGFVKVNSKGSYTFVKKEGGVNLNIGGVDSTNNVITTYHNPVALSYIPVTYLLSVADTYTAFGTGSTDTAKGIAQFTADGWGTLHLPNGNYTNVVRVKKTYQQIDSTIISGNKVPLILTATAYYWYDNMHYSALLRWDSTHVDYGIGQTDVKTLTYLHSETYPVSVKDIYKSLSATAIISGQTLIATANFETGKTYEVTLRSMNGQQLYNSKHLANNGHMELQLGTELPAGIYFVSFTEAGSGITETIKTVTQ